MIEIIRSSERGETRTDWLFGRHTFSFGAYRNPKRNGFGPLIVINDDIIRPGAGFGSHPHRDMEIITYVLNGALEHKDSMNNIGVINAGEVQRMSAGSGVTHSEYNHSKTDPVHLLQIWVKPLTRSSLPRYDQFALSSSEQKVLIASGQDTSALFHIDQDLDLYRIRFDAANEYSHPMRPTRSVYIHTILGPISVNGSELNSGDGAYLNEAAELEIKAESKAQLLLFDFLK